MKKHILLTIAFLCFTATLFGQSDSYIEVAVTELVDLKTNKVLVNIEVEEITTEDDEPIKMPFIVDNVKKIFTKNNIKYEVISGDNGFAGIMGMELSESYPSVDIDSIIQILVGSQEELTKIMQLLKEQPVVYTVEETEYESMDNRLEEVLPILTKKAQHEAGLMAKSMNRKLGKIVSCTNSSDENTGNFLQAMMTEAISSVYTDKTTTIDNCFTATKKAPKSYVYRFRLLD